MLEIKIAERNGLLCLSGCGGKIYKGEKYIEEKHYRGTTRMCKICFIQLKNNFIFTEE